MAARCGATGAAGSSNEPTPGEDDDPLDVLVLCQEPIPLTLMQARTIGVMTMIDAGTVDHKIIAVATADPEYNHYHEARELPPHKLAMVRRFFQDYKKLEGKTVQVERIEPARTAYPLINQAVASYKKKMKNSKRPKAK